MRKFANYAKIRELSKKKLKLGQNFANCKKKLQRFAKMNNSIQFLHLETNFCENLQIMQKFTDYEKIANYAKLCELSLKFEKFCKCMQQLKTF